MQCAHCGATVSPHVTFCTACGHPIAEPAEQPAAPHAATPERCAACGAALEPGARFCTSCGRALGDGHVDSAAALRSPDAGDPARVPAAPGEPACARVAAPATGIGGRGPSAPATGAVAPNSAAPMACTDASSSGAPRTGADRRGSSAGATAFPPEASDPVPASALASVSASASASDSPSASKAASALDAPRRRFSVPAIAALALFALAAGATVLWFSGGFEELGRALGGDVPGQAATARYLSTDAVAIEASTTLRPKDVEGEALDGYEVRVKRANDEDGSPLDVAAFPAWTISGADGFSLEDLGIDQDGRYELCLTDDDGVSYDLPPVVLGSQDPVSEAVVEVMAPEGADGDALARRGMYGSYLDVLQNLRNRYGARRFPCASCRRRSISLGPPGSRMPAWSISATDRSGCSFSTVRARTGPYPNCLT